MTNIEFIRATLGVNYPLDDAFFIAILTSEGIYHDAEYVKDKAFYKALINSLMLLLSGAKRISEGGYTVEIDTNAILKLISMWCNRWGLPDPTKDGYVSGYPTKLW